MWLNESYNKETFKNFLSDFLPDDLDLSEKELVIRDSYKEIKSGVVLGECPSLGLKILQLEHEKERDPRVALAKEAFKALAENWAKKALVVFTSKNSDNWRLSFMTISFDINEKNRVVTNLSNPKRKSFFLGPDSKIATPNKFLIKNGKVKNIEDLESRFDVEVVTKEFFDNYRKLFDKLNSYLKEDRAFNVFAGNNRIKIDDFAKKLLGQIVFIYFLQRKGWLGAKKEQHIYEGGSNFIRNLYNRCVNKKGNFFNDTLEYLFYDAFNKEPEKAGSFYREYFDCQIPFLNGGLFESLNKYDWKNKILDLPNELFSNSDKTGILDIFDLYNFTIDENSPIDQEVSVDPEMLGKVFEKLLDTNKETGSFYTPREVVSYMVKQSLIEYLKTKTDVKDKDIEELINEHRISNQDLNKKDFKAIEDALKEIKIIDPAVGSGAFPVGILQEMTEIRKICLDKITVKPRLAYDIKREILENNIYGVDIDHGAIDIARLRFWLSLVVDADLFDVEPLPNLDFKLTAANTLLKLDKQQGLSDDTELLGKMKGLREKYFRARTRNGKEKIQKSFEKLIGINKTVDAFETSRQKQIKTYNPFSPSTVAQFFDPEFMFGVKEFDLIIGNPPYIKEYTSKDAFKDLKKSPYYQGKMDLWYFFACYGLDFLKKDGIETFIAPNNWTSNFGAKIMRKKVLDEAKIFQFIDFGNYKVFDMAGIQTMVYLIKKDSNNKSYKLKFAKLKNDNSGTKILNNFLDASFKEDNSNFEKFIFDFNKKIFKDKNIQFLNNQINKIINKIEANGDFYLNNKDVANGIHPHFDFVGKKQLVNLGPEFSIGDGIFALSNNEKENLNLSENEKSLIRPYFLTSNFCKHNTVSKNNYWIIYTESKFKNKNEIEKYPNIKKHLDQFQKIITSSNRPYGLHRARDEKFFKGEKIVVARKCLSPEFSYNNFDCYVSATFYIIKTDRINTKYLLGILNSTLIKYWLKHKGKMQGNNYQIDKEPLLQIPISKVSSKNQNLIINRVEKILDITKKENFNPKNIPTEQLELENEIDKMVYGFYGLTEEDIKIVEKSIF